MRREDVNYIVSFLLLFSLIITAMVGYLQSVLDLRKFLPHRWFAYTTLSLGVIHVSLHAGRIIRYLKRKFNKKTFTDENGG